MCNYIRTSLVAAAVGVPIRELSPPDANVGNASTVQRFQSCIFNGSRPLADYPTPEMFTADNVCVGGRSLLPPFKAALRQYHRIIHLSGVGPKGLLGASRGEPDEVLFVKGPVAVAMIIPFLSSNPARIDVLARHLYAALP